MFSEAVEWGGCQLPRCRRPERLMVRITNGCAMREDFGPLTLLKIEIKHHDVFYGYHG